MNAPGGLPTHRGPADERCPPPAAPDLAVLQADLRVFARGLLARAGAASPAVRAGVGDVEEAAGDVASEAVATLWVQRDRWAQLDDVRAWAFGVTRIQVARHVRAARRRAAVEAPLGDGVAERLPDTSAPAPTDHEPATTWNGASGARALALSVVRTQVVERLGAEAWDRVAARCARSARTRGATGRAVLVEQIERAADGRLVDVAALARAGGVGVEVWAAGQVAAGRRLDPARAVQDGAATDVLRARRSLATWLSAQSTAGGPALDAGALERAGVLDDQPADRRGAAARSLAGWLAWNRPGSRALLVEHGPVR